MKEFNFSEFKAEVKAARAEWAAIEDPFEAVSARRDAIFGLSRE